MWELDISYDGGRCWNTAKTGPSCDSCKNVARELHTDPGFESQKFLYRIYAGNQLVYVSGPNMGWRLCWFNGNLKPRSEQK